MVNGLSSIQRVGSDADLEAAGLQPLGATKRFPTT